MKMDSFGEATLRIDVATAITKGQRDHQQDSALTSFPIGQDTGFAIVADGMGGSVAGHVASALATCTVFEHLRMQGQATENAGGAPTVLLRNAAVAANARIAQHAEEVAETFGMGTTLLVPWIQDGKLYWLSVGDSPFLLFRDGALRMLNQDHSMGSQIDMMVKAGAMDAQTAQEHPERSVLTSALEGKDIPIIDCPPVPLALKAGDILVAATDGLQYLPNAMIANTLMLTQSAQSADIANALLSSLEMQNHPDQDNAAIVVIKLVETVGRSTSRAVDDLPVLAMADTAEELPITHIAPPPREPDPEPEAAAPKKKKTFFYRGQEYEKED